jgi:hypothetical protein
MGRYLSRDSRARRGLWIVAVSLILVSALLIGLLQTRGVAAAILERTDSQALLGLAAQYHRDDEVRRAAVRWGLQDSRLLARIGAADPSAGVRREAIARLGDSALTGVAMSSQYPDARLAAVNRLSDQDVLAAIARTDSHRGVASGALEQLVNQSLLMQVAMAARLQSVRLAAVGRLEPALVADFARNASVRDLGLAAVWSLGSRTLLADVALTARRADVRQAARWALEEQEHFGGSPARGAHGEAEAALEASRCNDSDEPERLWRTGRARRYVPAIVTRDECPVLDRPNGSAWRRLRQGDGILVAVSGRAVPTGDYRKDPTRETDGRRSNPGEWVYARLPEGDVGWLRREHCAVVPYHWRLPDAHSYDLTFHRPSGRRVFLMCRPTDSPGARSVGVGRAAGTVDLVIAIEHADGSGAWDWWARVGVWQTGRRGWLRLDDIHLSFVQLLLHAIISSDSGGASGDRANGPWSSTSLRTLVGSHDAERTTYPIRWNPEASDIVWGHAGASLALLAADLSDRGSQLAAWAEVTRRPVQQLSFEGSVSIAARWRRANWLLEAKRIDEALPDLRFVARHGCDFPSSARLPPIDRMALEALRAIHVVQHGDPAAWEQELVELTRAGPAGRRLYREFRNQEIRERILDESDAQQTRTAE